MNASSSSSPVISAALSGHVAQAMQGMGAIVFWELAGTRITPGDLRAILAHEGLQIDVPEIEPEGAIRRAVRNWATGRGDDRYRADLVDIQDPTAMKVCILHRREEGSASKKSAKWETVESVVFSLQTRTWTASASTSEVQSFIALGDEYLRYLDHNFIRPSIIQARLEEMMAFSLKASSGLWYVTQDQMENLATLQRVVASIGKSAMYVIHVGETDQSRNAIQTAAKGALSETLAELEAKLESWVSSTRKIRSDAIDTTLMEFAALVERAELYQGALQVRMDDLSDRIRLARDRARQIIDGNLGNHQNPDLKPLGKKGLQIMEAVEIAFPSETFTIKMLEELVGSEGSGALQTHLRDACRLGRLHRKGRDSSGAMLYAVGPAPQGSESSAEEEGGEESQPEQALLGSVEGLPVDAASALPDAAEIQVLEPELTPESVPAVVLSNEPEMGSEMGSLATEEEPAGPEPVTIPEDDVLIKMSRDELREVAKQLRQNGIEIPRASKMGREDLARAISQIREI